MAEPLFFVPIEDLHDELLLPWLDLYETAFPPTERVLISTILENLGNQKFNKERDMHIDAIMVKNNLFIGIAMYELPLDKPVAILWYVAVDPEQRSKGWGSLIYHQLLSKLDPKVITGLFFEVEIPNDSHSSSDAVKRIRFYQKNGAKLLTGIHYMQSVGWHQPPTPMHIMVHPLQPMDAETAYKLAYSIFGEAMQKTGTLALE